MALSLSGCRHSPVLVDDVYTQNAKEIDSEQIEVETTEDDEPDEALEQSRQDQASENRNSQEETETQSAGTSVPQTDDTVSAINTRPNGSEASSSATVGGDGEQQTQSNIINGAKGGSETGSGQGTGSGEKSGEVADGSNEQGDAQGDTSALQENESNSMGQTDPPNIPETSHTDPSDYPEQQGNTEIGPTVKNVPRKTVTDGNGEIQNVPKDVFTVTAVGDAAPIVEMVGGSGRLLATSQSFTDLNGLGYALCSDVQSGAVQTWWYNDGSKPIDDLYFQELLRQSPDVCFEISGQTTFTQDQITQLQAYGIGYVPLPDLTSLDRMKQAVTIVAETLAVNKSSGIDSGRIAQSYCEWIDAAINEVHGFKPSFTQGDVGWYPEYLYGTLYITQWRDDISFQRKFDPSPSEVTPYVELPGMENGYGTGVALAWTINKRQPLWEIEQSIWISPCEIGISHRLERDNGITEGYVFPYEGSFGYPVFSDNQYYYFNTSGSERAPRYERGTIYPFTTGAVDTLSAVCGTYGDYWSNTTNNGTLGHERYPAVIAANDFVRNRILASPQWKAGYSPNDRDNCIYGDYAVYVNPVGFRNWAEGGIDAPLEAYWLAARITGTIDENTLYNRIQSFYQSYFGVRLSTSQIYAIINR